MLALMSWGSLAQPCGATIHPVSPPPIKRLSFPWLLSTSWFKHNPCCNPPVQLSR